MGILFPSRHGGYGRRRMGCNPRILIGLVIAVISVVTYIGYRTKNPTTGETQYISLSTEDEVALGLHVAPEMAAQFGGLHPNQEIRLRVQEIGDRIVARSDASKAPYKFIFHALADPQTINAFALPGGQIFITAALLERLETDGQIAGVLAHEIVHVVGRHSAEHIAKAELVQGLTGAAVMATYDPTNPSSYQNAAFAQMVGQLINLKYGRDDESESDELGVKFMIQAGYDPRAMLRVMEILRDASEGGRQPEFLSTHPDPGRRLERIQELIDEHFPDGVPAHLEK